MQVPHRSEKHFSPPAFSGPLLHETVRSINENILHIHKHKEHHKSTYCTWGDDTVHFSSLSFFQVEVWPRGFEFLVKAGHHRHMIDLLRTEPLTIHNNTAQWHVTILSVSITTHQRTFLAVNIRKGYVLYLWNYNNSWWQATMLLLRCKLKEDIIKGKQF